MYLLDTDILSNLMKRSPSGALVAGVARVEWNNRLRGLCRKLGRRRLFALGRVRWLQGGLEGAREVYIRRCTDKKPRE